jgi:hypothetical protein
MNSFSWMVRCAACAAPAVLALGRQDPATGQDVLTRMQSAYEGKWYHTLTFVQITTFHRPDGSTATQRWYEAARGPSTLRIDLDSATSGNGMLYLADSTLVVRNGAVVMRAAGGNPFLPLIMGAYLQPVDATARELTQHGFDLARVRRDTWRGRSAWVVGSASPSDTLAPQFWIDTERLVLVRLLFRFGSAQTFDVDVGGYEPIGDSWLGTRIVMRSGGRTVQEEVYQDWRVDVPLDTGLFDPRQWRSAPHWATRRP